MLLQKYAIDCQNLSLLLVSVIVPFYTCYGVYAHQLQLIHSLLLSFHVIFVYGYVSVAV